MIACGKPFLETRHCRCPNRYPRHISRGANRPRHQTQWWCPSPLPSDRSSDGWSARPLPNSSPRRCAALPAHTSLPVGTKQGSELLHKIVSAHVAIHRDAAMASVDIKKKHGAVEWGAIQSEIEASDKNIWKWCAVLFKAGHVLTCKLDNGDIITHTMRRGLAQGCPMSSLIFTLTVHRTVSTVENQMRNADPNARVNIYQDDLTPNGNADPLAGGLALLQKKFSHPWP